MRRGLREMDGCMTSEGRGRGWLNCRAEVRIL